MSDTKAVKYKIMFSGDTHASSRNYGGHFDYPKESLLYLKKLNEIAKENGITHDIRLGDLSYGRFHSLEYRYNFEQILREAKNNVNGNLYILKGNHDVSSTGMTEYEFYLNTGWFKGAENITLDKVNISMLNYGEANTKQIITPSDNTIDIIAGHDYYKFADTQLPNYGTGIDIDNKEEWYGVDIIALGHIHKHHKFKGNIIKNGVARPTLIEYLNCPCRPSYDENLDTKWVILVITVYEDGSVSAENLEVDLFPLEECFNFDKMQAEKLVASQKKIDMSDIVQRVGAYTTAIGDPEIIIQNMADVDQKYKDKALELLRS